MTGASDAIPARSGPEVDRQDQLDYLRGLAALMVVANHVRGAFFVGGRDVLSGAPTVVDYVTIAALQLTSFGTDAVVLFFVLSGYAMAHSISRSTSTKRFYLRRILRIWPPYVAALILAWGVARIAGIDDFQLLPRLFYLNWGGDSLTPQYWSLPYEVAFYALCPLILRSTRAIHTVAGVSVAAFVATTAIAGPTINPWGVFILDLAGSEMLLFSVGALAFVHADRIPRVNRVTFLAAVVLTLAIAWATKQWLTDVNLISMVLIAAMSVLAIVNVRPIAWFNLGFFSYSLYIFHYALIVLIDYVAGTQGYDMGAISSPVAWIPLAIIISLACLALYHVTERVSNQWVAALRRPARRERVEAIAG